MKKAFGMSKIKNILHNQRSNDDVPVEFIGLIDESSNADATTARIQTKIANMISLGLKRGRPRLEEYDNEKDAA